MQKKHTRLMDLILSRGLVTEEQLEEALEEKKAKDISLEEALVSLGLISEREMITILCQQMKVGYAELRTMKLDEEAVYLIDGKAAKKYNLIPVGFDGENKDIIQVAMADPMDFAAIDDLEIITNKRIYPMLAQRGQIAFQIDKYFGKQSVLDAADEYKREYETERATREIETIRNGQNDESPIVRIVQSIMEQAVRQRASDIHLEPMNEEIRIRFRIDGNLIEVMRYDMTIFPALIARVKIIAGMDISEKRKPLDGRTSIMVDQAEYDVRVSSIPTVHGEKVVMRLANKEGLARDKRSLGLRENELKIFERMLGTPHGLILVTGPTGSGKSTTLYTALNELNQDHVNIVTIEDPVEAILPGISQIQVNVKADMTFANALRSILRQDPDIIMVGEIRDSETAEIAVQASITGHLVVSTLHTNSTSASIGRLVNMGVEPYLIADALVGVVAQRLCRRLCICKKGRKATVLEKQELGAGAEEEITIYEPHGCPLCSHTGYYGRIGVYELMPISQSLREQITNCHTASLLQEAAIKEGMTTLRQSAVLLVRKGITSISELHKIACEED